MLQNLSHPHSLVPYPRSRQLMVDGGQLGLKKHTIHGLVELDITSARKSLKEHRAKTGEALSFSAFFLTCLGKAIEQDKSMQSYRKGRHKLVIFDDVDVNMLFETEVDGQKTIRPHIIRSVNKKSAAAVHREIRDFQSHHQESEESKFIDWFVTLPGFIRRTLLRFLFRNPHFVKEYYGTVLVTSIGMFGAGAGWGIPVSNHTLQLTLGGMSEQPCIVGDQVETRKVMSVTVSFDHDVVDGAPAARFIHQLKKLVESGYQPGV